MKSILAGTEEIEKAEVFTIQKYNFFARLATLQNLSEQIAKVDFSEPRTQDFETILIPTEDFQKRYKTLRDLPECDQIIEKSTQTIDLPKAKTSPRLPMQNKNFLKINKNDLKVASAPVSAKQYSTKPTPRKSKKSPKLKKTAESKQKTKKNEEKLEPDQDLLPIIYKQFSDLVLMQWEEAADLLIDELLQEEIEFLNSREAGEEVKIPQNADEIFSELEKIQEFKMEMREKYLNK